jgi:hypothetical protein
VHPLSCDTLRSLFSLHSYDYEKLTCEGWKKRDQVYASSKQETLFVSLTYTRKVYHKNEIMGSFHQTNQLTVNYMYFSSEARFQSTVAR